MLRILIKWHFENALLASSKESAKEGKLAVSSRWERDAIDEADDGAARCARAWWPWISPFAEIWNMKYTNCEWALIFICWVGNARLVHEGSALWWQATKKTVYPLSLLLTRHAQRQRKTISNVEGSAREWCVDFFPQSLVSRQPRMALCGWWGKTRSKTVSNSFSTVTFDRVNAPLQGAVSETKELRIQLSAFGREQNITTRKEWKKLLAEACSRRKWDDAPGKDFLGITESPWQVVSGYLFSISLTSLKIKTPKPKQIQALLLAARLCYEEFRAPLMQSEQRQACSLISVIGQPRSSSLGSSLLIFFEVNSWFRLRRTTIISHLHCKLCLLLGDYFT